MSPTPHFGLWLIEGDTAVSHSGFSRLFLSDRANHSTWVNASRRVRGALRVQVGSGCLAPTQMLFCVALTDDNYRRRRMAVDRRNGRHLAGHGRCPEAGRSIAGPRPEAPEDVETADQLVACRPKDLSGRLPRPNSNSFPNKSLDVREQQRGAMSIRTRLAMQLIGDRRVEAKGFPASHAELSVISSLHDQAPAPTGELIELALRASSAALNERLPDLAGRVNAEPDGHPDPSQWPGEHYRLLAGLVRTLMPSSIVEVGTFTGMGTLALKEACDVRSRIVTYDVIPWRETQAVLLNESDFVESVDQRIGDLSDPAFFRQELPTLMGADLIFIDGPKDGRFEPRFMSLLVPALVSSGSQPVLVFDDIRVMPMTTFWRDFPMPKLDITSFGHWAGTGVARISNRNGVT